MENIVTTQFKSALQKAGAEVTDTQGKKEIRNLYSQVEGETKEATSTGGGTFEPPAFSLFSSEAPKKTQSKGGKVKKEKGEFKEATSSASSGSYVGASFLAKSQNKKDWRGVAKPLYKGGKFVRVKKKCKTFPYCNQGDIKALELWEDDKLTEAIKKVAKNKNIHENVVRAIVLNEIEEKLFGE